MSLTNQQLYRQDVREAIMGVVLNAYGIPNGYDVRPLNSWTRSHFLRKADAFAREFSFDLDRKTKLAERRRSKKRKRR